MPSIYVDVDLDNFSTRELILELEGRYLDEHEAKALFDILTDPIGEKLKFLLSIEKGYTLFELEQLFSRTDSVNQIPKEQLSLGI